MVDSGTIAAGVSIASNVLGFGASRRARRRARRAARLRARQIAMQNARERRETVRDFRAKRAAAMVAGASGAVDIASSMPQGMAGALGSQLSSGMDFIRRSSALNMQATRAELSSDRAAGQAATFGAIGQVAGTVADMTGGWDTLAERIGIKVRSTDPVSGEG
jgi:hypothetical protein